MSSLRRILSLECAEISSLPLQSCSSRRRLARYHSLPSLSFRSPRGLPSLPLPSSSSPKARRGRHSHGFFSCELRREGPPLRLASFRSAPAWSVDDEADSGALTATWPATSKEYSGTEDSVVYKELRDSIRYLQAPSRYAQVLSSEGVLGSSHTHVDVGVCEEEKKRVEPSGIDARGRPLSLRMLKKRVSRKFDPCMSSEINQAMQRQPPVLMNRGEAEDGVLCDMGGSVNSAFSSLVFMMESLQQHTMWLRRVFMSEADAHLQGMMAKVHQEMQDTFLWLFQKVFSCTPKLMFLTMMLLVDFAVHSMGEHVALGVMPMGEPPTCSIERVLTATDSHGPGSADPKLPATAASFSWQSLAGGPRLCAGGAGDKVVRTLKVGGGMEGEALPIASADQAAMTTEDETQSGLNDTSFHGCYSLFDGEGYLKAGSDNCAEHEMLSALWRQAVSKESNLRPLTPSGHILVAPVQAPELEADNYPCYDRTDLKYQHELSMDPSNPLLLANYAQFLHVVRHDHNRAEVLYKRAVKADPVDGEVMGKYASFLWVAKEDAEAADEAYKAALTVDPTNVYHAGSYAHFLWNSSAGQEDSAPVTTPYQEVSTT